MPHSSYHDDEEEEDHDAAHFHREHDSGEELLEPAGFLNDLSYRDEEYRTIDLSEFFPISKAFAISGSRARIFSDMRRGRAKPLHFAKKRSISIDKPKYRYHDILSQKRCDRGVLGYFKDASLLRINPVSLMEPLGEFPENTLDIRTLETIIVVRRADIYLLPPTLRRRIRNFRRRHHRAIVLTGVGFFGVSAVLIAAVAGSVFVAKNELEAGYRSLESLTKTKTFSEFRARSDDAVSHFRMAKPFLFGLSALLDTPIYSSEQIRSAKALGDGGESVAKSISLVQTMLTQIGEEWKIQSISDIETVFSSGSQVKITDILREHASDIASVGNNLESAVSSYSRVGNLGDSAMQKKFSEAVEMIFFAKEAISSYRAHQDSILSALGDERPMRYLILNQNRDELRASGGFPGSAIFVEFYKGRISKYEKKDIYYYDWHLYPFAEAAPEGIREISDKLGLRDANYAPEFKDTFATIDRLYQKAWGSSLDGLLAINQGIIIDLLEKYGSVRIPSIGKTVDSKNFSTLMSILVEAQIGRKTSAKDILFEFITELEKKLLAIKDYQGYFDIVKKEVKNGEILFAGREESVSSLANEILGNSEGWKNDTGNFIYPIFTSLSANKSDRYIKRGFNITSRLVAASGSSASGSSILNSFTLDSTHAMTIDDREKIRAMLYDFAIPQEKHEQLIFVEWAGRNISWVRLVVPKGSRITGTPPIAVKTDDSNAAYTIFSFEVTTEFLGSSRVFFDYLSPVASDTVARFYHQSGLTNYSVTAR